MGYDLEERFCRLSRESKGLDPRDLRCVFCKRQIAEKDIVAVIDFSRDPEAFVVAHLHHHGVRNEIRDPVQITAGSLLIYIADEMGLACD